MNFPLRQRRVRALFLLICSTVSLTAQENRDRPRQLDKTPVGAKTKPNIVLMLTDNLGYGELGVYGGGLMRGAPPPGLAKLARGGMRLLNFKFEAPRTPNPSRPSAAR